MKTAIISGASKGIGKAAAITFAEAGYQVFNLSRSSAGLDGIKDVSVDLAADDITDVLNRDVIPELDPLEPIVLIHNAAKLASGASEKFPVPL